MPSLEYSKAPLAFQRTVSRETVGGRIKIVSRETFVSTLLLRKPLHYKYFFVSRETMCEQDNHYEI